MPILHERMDAIDHEQMILDYSVPAVEYLRVKNYRARTQVVALGASPSATLGRNFAFAGSLVKDPPLRASRGVPVSGSRYIAGGF